VAAVAVPVVVVAARAAVGTVVVCSLSFMMDLIQLTTFKQDVSVVVVVVEEEGG
jgi:hypothetical protein